MPRSNSQRIAAHLHLTKFIEGLQSVPLTDPYSLTIAVHPYETFSQLHKLPTLPPYDEILQTTNDALRFIKSNTKTATCLPKTERIIWDDDCKLPLDNHIRH